MPGLHLARLSQLIKSSPSRLPSSYVSDHHRRAFGGLAMRSQQQLSPRRSILLTGLFASPLCRVSSVQILASMGEPQKNDEDPKDFQYVQLWVSEDGESHIKEGCKMTGFKTQIYSSMPQYVKDEFGGQPQKIIFTELSVGMEQPLHTCPDVQFVVTLSGSWYIKTTDGAKYVFKPGQVLFQDNTKSIPAKKPGQHLSGAVGDVPCQQFIVQFNRPPEVDNPNAF